MHLILAVAGNQILHLGANVLASGLLVGAELEGLALAVPDALVKQAVGGVPLTARHTLAGTLLHAELLLEIELGGSSLVDGLGWARNVELAIVGCVHYEVTVVRGSHLHYRAGLTKTGSWLTTTKEALLFVVKYVHEGEDSTGIIIRPISTSSNHPPNHPLSQSMSFAATFGKLVVFLTKHGFMHAIRKLASDPDVVSGIHGKEEREAINAARRIVREYQLEVATWLILNESNAEGELASSLGSDEEPTVAPVITSNQGKRPAGDKAFAAKKQRVGVEEDSMGRLPLPPEWKSIGTNSIGRQ